MATAAAPCRAAVARDLPLIGRRLAFPRRSSATASAWRLRKRPVGANRPAFRPNPMNPRPQPHGPRDAIAVALMMTIAWAIWAAAFVAGSRAEHAPPRLGTAPLSGNGKALGGQAGEFGVALTAMVWVWARRAVNRGPLRRSSTFGRGHSLRRDRRRLVVVRDRRARRLAGGIGASKGSASST